MPVQTIKKRFYALLVIIYIFTAAAHGRSNPVLYGESEGMGFRVEQLARGLDVPWGMAFLTPNDIIFTLRDGGIGLLAPGSGRVTPMTGSLPKILRGGQGGMLDVAVPREYSPGDWIYFTYSRPAGGQGVTTLARARRDGDRIRDWQDLVVTRSATSREIHYGSRIAFDTDGRIYFTVGDRGYRPNAQDLTTHAGSVLRVNTDGSIPYDNPFAAGTSALPEIYSYGHRNPQGIAFDAPTNRLWVIEHGPRGGDEINLVAPGKNYGWPVISYGKEYWGPVRVGEGTAKEGMEQPVKVYTPSIAPASLLLYSGKAFPKWQGNLFAGALKLTHLNRVALDRSGAPVTEERLLEDLDERIRAVIQSPEGWIYFSTDSGGIYRIRPRS